MLLLYFVGINIDRTTTWWAMIFKLLSYSFVVYLCLVDFRSLEMDFLEMACLKLMC